MECGDEIIALKRKRREERGKSRFRQGRKKTRNTHREIKIEKYRNRLKDRKILKYAETQLKMHTRERESHCEKM